MNTRDLKDKIKELTEEARKLIKDKKLEEARKKKEEIERTEELLRQSIKQDEEEKEKLIKQSKRGRGAIRNLGINTIEKRESFYGSVIKKSKEELSIGKYVRGMLTGDWSNAEREENEFRVLNTTTGSTLIPQTLSAQIIDLARPQMALGEIPIIPMESNNLTIAKIKKDPKFEFKEELEKAEISEMSFEPIELKSKTVYGLMKVSLELLESAKNIDVVIQKAMASALAQAIDEKGLYGTNEKEPKGILTYEDINIIESDTIEKTKYTSFIKGIGEITKNNGVPNTISYNSGIDTALDLLIDTTGQPLNPPKKIEGMTHKVSNNIKDNQAVVYDNGAIVMGVQNKIRIETSRELGFEDGSVWLRVYGMVDFAILNPKNVTLIKYRTE